MAINTIIDGNFLVIDDGVKKQYWSSGWVSIRFDSENVFLTNDVLQSQAGNENPRQIALSDFEYDGASIVTEDLIFAELKDKIGSGS